MKVSVHSSTLRAKLEEIGDSHDKEVIVWKQDVEHKLSVLDATKFLSNELLLFDITVHYCAHYLHLEQTGNRTQFNASVIQGVMEKATQTVYRKSYQSRHL